MVKYGSNNTLKAQAQGFLNSNVKKNGESSTLPKGVSSKLEKFLQLKIKKSAPSPPFSGSTQNTTNV
jgi:hypothetical protein